MNILNLLKYSPDFGGGISKHLLALSKIAKSNGHKLFVGFPEKRNWQSDLTENATIIIIPELNKSFSISLPGIINSICKSHSIDIIHSHFSFGIPFSISISQRGRDLPFIHHWHNPPIVLNKYITPPSSLIGTLKRSISSNIARFTDARTIDLHISISNEITEMLTLNRWTEKEKVIFLPNGIIPTKIQLGSRKIEKDKTVTIGTIANFRQQKDHKTLIKAFGLLRNEVRNVELWIVGDGPTRSSMETLARKLKISSHIKFLGTVLNPTEIINQFDIFVLSTNYEGHPLVLLEAMSYSLPIVATRISSIPEVIEDGVNGLLVNPKDPIDLTKVILSIIQNKALYQKLSEQSALSYNNQLTLDQWAAKVISIYENLFG